MKKRNLKFFKAKHIIRLKLKDQEISRAIRNQGYVELETPIHDGYYADYVLRKDITNREDASAYQEALDACKTQIWSKNKDFRYKDYKTKKWMVSLPKLLEINKAKYEALGVQSKRFFYETFNADKKYWRQGFSDKTYRCNLSYELVVVITKAYITHRREHDSVLYQMDAENEKLLYKISDGHPWDGYSENRFYHRLVNRSLKLAAQREIVEVKKIYKGLDTKDDLLDR